MAAEHAPFNAYARHSRISIDKFKDTPNSKDLDHLRKNFAEAREDDFATRAHEKKSGKTYLIHGDADHHPSLLSWHGHVGAEDRALLQERPRKDACVHTEPVHKKIVGDCYETAVIIPPDFICGLSKRVMKDPVVVASGISYERASIQAWLDRGKTCCPRTGLPLAHLQLIPNLTLKNLISSWLAFHSGLPFPLTTTCNQSSLSSSLDASVPCPNLGASLDTHHHTSASSLPKLPQNVGFSPSSTSSSPPSSPMHLRSSLRHKQDDPLRCPVYVTARISTLVTRIQCGHIDKQRHAVTELRILAKHDDNNRMMIANAGALDPLLKLLHSTDEATQQEATTALLNLSLNHTVRDDAVKAGVIEPLVRVVKEGMSEVAMENAAAALTHISCKEENKEKVGAAGAIPPLLELLDNGSSRGRKDAATALYSLTSIDENKKRVVRAGATRLLLSFMCEEGKDTNRRDGMEEKATAILRNLVHVEVGRVAFVEEGGIKALFQVMQTGSSKSKSLGIPILYQLCKNSTKHRALVLQREPLPLLMNLSESGNFRVKVEIDEILHVLREPPKMNHM